MVIEGLLQAQPRLEFYGVSNLLKIVGYILLWR